jgi:hypothetical protein
MRWCASLWGVRGVGVITFPCTLAQACVLVSVPLNEAWDDLLHVWSVPGVLWVCGCRCMHSLLCLTDSGVQKSLKGLEPSIGMQRKTCSVLRFINLRS